MTQMNAEQSDTATGPRAPSERHVIRFVVLIVVSVGLILAGAICLIGPLLGSSSASGHSWQWTATGVGDVGGITYKCVLHGVGPNGLRVSKKVGTPISLTWVKPSFSDDIGRTVEVEASVPGASGAEEQAVRFFWQTKGTSTWESQAVHVPLGPKPTTVRFTLTASPSQIEQIAVQFPDARDDVVLRRVTIKSIGLLSRLKLALSQAWDREPFKNSSINFLRGPSILGYGINSYLVGVLAIGIGGVLLLIAFRSSRKYLPVLVGIVIFVWAAEDVRATWNLYRNANSEVEHFAKSDERTTTWAESLNALDIEPAASDAIAWAADLLKENADAGSTYCVISDDTFMVPHRLDYLVVPKLVKIDDCHDADFIVVLFSSGADYDADKQILTLPDNSKVSARPVAQMDFAYILHNNRSTAE